MSVVAWDGKTLAADKQKTCAGHGAVCTKIRVTTGLMYPGHVVAWTGQEEIGHLLARWYEQGADPERWPSIQSDSEKWCRLIVLNGHGIFTYEQFPIAVREEAPFMAWGSGRDFALAALRLGHDARRAVELTNELSIDCGFGVDSFTTAQVQV
jgi:hypothetical protein